MVKKVFRAITLRTLPVLACVLRNALFGYFVRFLKLLYWNSLKPDFKVVGRNSHIDFPAFLHGAQYISIGSNFIGKSRLRLEAIDSRGGYFYTPCIIIGDNVRCEPDFHIACVNRVVIGDNALIASRVYITDHFHGEISADALKQPPYCRQVVSKGPVVIEDNVWIGEGAAIMPSVTVGKNAIIGANAVVTRDVPPNSVVGGVPARVIRILG